MIVIAISILLTSFLSGILGMGGGMILMGILSLKLPIVSAMLLHGITQGAANGSRAFLLRRHIRWGVVPPFFLGSALSFILIWSIQFVPDRGAVLALIGLFPIASLIIPKTEKIDITRPGTALLCGFAVTITKLVAGASGPILDLFFLNKKLDRFSIIATKALTQTIGHTTKLVHYGSLLSSIDDLSFHPSLLLIAVLTAFLGTRAGKMVLTRLSEYQFRSYSRMLIVCIAAIYLSKGLYEIFL